MTLPRTAVRTRVVEAAARLLHEQGPSAVTTRAVAEAAATQAPTIYRLFGDKDGLLDAVAEHELTRYAADKAAAVETDDPLADLRAAWDRHVAFSLEHPALFGFLVDPERGARSPAAAAGLAVLRRRVHRLAVAGLLRVPEERVVALVHAAGTGAVLTLLALPPDQRDAHLLPEIREAVLARVLVPAAVAPEAVEPAHEEASGPSGAAGGTPTPTPHRVEGAARGAVAAATVTLRAAAHDLPGLTDAERAVLAEWLDRVGAG